MIRVLIADDHAILRRGLAEIISEAGDMEVVGEAESSAQTLKFARDHSLDVVLLDIDMPDRNGIDTLKLLKSEKPKLPVLMLTLHPESIYALRAIKAGASGYLNKQSAPTMLVTAIRQVATGRRYISPATAEALADAAATADQPAHTTLSDREYETMRLIASGRTLTLIAAEMHLSVKTVSVYRARLLEKMQLKNNAELTHYVLKNKLIDSRPETPTESLGAKAIQSEIVTNTLRLLASRRLDPTPANYQQCYLEISGQKLAEPAPEAKGTPTGEPPAPVWASELIAELLKQWQPAKPD
jgi:DNA-binding NarL/FixJ family response regulator